MRNTFLYKQREYVKGVCLFFQKTIVFFFLKKGIIEKTEKE